MNRTNRRAKELRQKKIVLLREPRRTALLKEYAELSRKYDLGSILMASKEHCPSRGLPVMSVRDVYIRDDRIRALICEKVLRLQEEKSISTYGTCKNLRLDNANVNTWLKNNACGKVSLSTAKNVLRYMESADSPF